MTINTAQQALLKAAIAGDANLNVFPNNPDGNFEVARLLNQPASPTFTVWRTEAPVSDILDQIDWSKYTPNDAADNTATYTNRALLAQTKQMNLQLMLQGKTSINASKANVRSGLRDAVIAVPTGASGANVNPGGTSGTPVLNACTRSALYIEKVLSTTSAQTGAVTANLLDWEGPISPTDVQTARNS